MTPTDRSGQPPLLFSTLAYRYLREAMLEHARFEEGLVEENRFPDGERYLRLLCQVEGRDATLIGGTISDSDTLELYDLACALVMYGVHRLTVVIPYFGYSTMERAIKPGEAVTAKNRAILLSSIPRAGSGNRIVLLDVHTEGLQHYFSSEIRPVHIYSKSVILQAAQRLGGQDFVMACTDAGRAKWVESLANELGVSASFVFKRRISGERTEVAAVSAQVQDKRVIIYDDMIRTGSSLVNAARAYKEAGARDIAAIATHGLFPGDALKRIQDTGLFTELVCTDSHPRALELAGEFLKVERVSGVLAAYLGR